VLAYVLDEPGPVHVDSATESAGFLLRIFSRFMAAAFHKFRNLVNLPHRVMYRVSRVRHYIMLSGEMLHEIILSISLVLTSWERAFPVLKLSMPLILMSDPVSFPFKGSRISTVWEGAYKRLYILEKMLSPV
jgi:hypothetical protein